MTRTIVKMLIAGLCWTALHLLPVAADIVVMKSGERFSSGQVWQEGDKVRFNMQGLVVSVDKQEVASIKPDTEQGNSTSAAGPLKSVSNSQAPPPAADDLPSSIPVFKKPHTSGNSPPKRFSPRAQGGRDLGTGLEGIAWGVRPDAIVGLQSMKTDPAFGGIDQYWRPATPPLFGSTALDGLVFGFWRGQLYIITMWCKGHLDYSRLRKEVAHRFGDGIRNKSEKERYLWLDGDTQRMLEFDPDLKTGIFVMRSAELDALIKKEYPESSIK